MQIKLDSRDGCGWLTYTGNDEEGKGTFRT